MKTITMPKDIGIKNIKDFHRKLVKDLKNNREDIIIDFSNIPKVDLSVIQIITAVRKKAAREGFTVKFKSIHETVQKIFYICGYDKKREVI